MRIPKEADSVVNLDGTRDSIIGIRCSMEDAWEVINKTQTPGMFKLIEYEDDPDVSPIWFSTIIRPNEKYNKKYAEYLKKEKGVFGFLYDPPDELEYKVVIVHPSPWGVSFDTKNKPELEKLAKTIINYRLEQLGRLPAYKKTEVENNE